MVYTPLQLGKAARASLAILAIAAVTGCADERAPFEEACSKGDVESCFILGKMMLEGVGGPVSKKKAEKKLGRACDDGSAEACALAGNMLYARDDKLARRFLERACARRDPEACADAGWMLWWGEGGGADREIAVSRLSRSCEGGSARGCFLLGLLEARESTGDPARHLRRACELGEEMACGEGEAR